MDRSVQQRRVGHMLTCHFPDFPKPRLNKCLLGSSLDSPSTRRRQSEFIRIPAGCRASFGFKFHLQSSLLELRLCSGSAPCQVRDGGPPGSPVHSALPCHPQPQRGHHLVGAESSRSPTQIHNPAHPPSQVSPPPHPRLLTHLTSNLPSAPSEPPSRAPQPPSDPSYLRLRLCRSLLNILWWLPLP